METRNLSVLIPAYNEAERIVSTITSLKLIPELKEIVVIDDGSNDETGFLAEKAGAKVIRLEKNRGKGAALNIGANYISGQYVALIDGDLGDTAQEIKKLLMPIINGQADITIAIFPPASKKGGVGIVKKVSSYGLKKITKNIFHAPLSGQRVMSIEVFRELLPLSSGFGVEVGMTIDAIHKGYRILEVKTKMGHAETGRTWSDFRHRGLQLKDIIITFAHKAKVR